MWNIESASLVTVKVTDGRPVLPFIDVYFKLTVPRWLGLPLRLEVRPSFTAESAIFYYGLGNASSDQRPPRAPDSYFQYGRTHPSLDADVRFKIVDHVAGHVGARYTQNWIQTQADSKLVLDARTGSPEVKSLLDSLAQGGVALLKYGLQLDTRDNETSTHAGTFDTVDLRLSPGGTSWLPYRYAQATVAARGFIPIAKPSLTLAGRLVGDLLLGDPPFYELARALDTYAIGGTNGIRGVPAQRYYGKAKVIGNLELRMELFTFRALKKKMIFGTVAFVDAGRLWADTTPQPALDGTGLGLHFGVGGGVRLQSGSAFILRGDVAWSPDARPVGGYFSAGQLF